MAMPLAGASIAHIQDVLGHESDKMARHCAGEDRTVCHGRGEPVSDLPVATATCG